MLTIVHEGNAVELKPDTFIIIEKADYSLYEKLASEDLKLDFDGERLFIHSPASYQHEWIASEILNLCKEYFKQNPEKGRAIGSHFSLHLPSDHITEPDVVVIPPGEFNITDSVYNGIPLVIFGILSPSTRNHDLKEKKGWYAENKVPEFWFIDPENEGIMGYFLMPDGQYNEKKVTKGSLQSKILGGLVISTSHLFDKNI